jgi:hypothetical protein
LIRPFAFCAPPWSSPRWMKARAGCARGAGVLLALPAILRRGIIDTAREVFARSVRRSTACARRSLPCGAASSTPRARSIARSVRRSTACARRSLLARDRAQTPHRRDQDGRLPGRVRPHASDLAALPPRRRRGAPVCSVRARQCRRHRCYLDRVARHLRAAQLTAPNRCARRVMRRVGRTRASLRWHPVAGPPRRPAVKSGQFSRGVCQEIRNRLPLQKSARGSGAPAGDVVQGKGGSDGDIEGSDAGAGHGDDGMEVAALGDQWAHASAFCSEDEA